MKRDFDLVRKIMLDVQALPADSPLICLEYPNEYEQAEVNEHVALLIEAGLLKGKPLRAMSSLLQVPVQGLTWEGHNFIDSAKNDAIWRKAFEILKDKGIDATFDVLKGLLSAIALKAAGLS